MEVVWIQFKYVGTNMPTFLHFHPTFTQKLLIIEPNTWGYWKGVGAVISSAPSKPSERIISLAL